MSKKIGIEREAEKIMVKSMQNIYIYIYALIYRRSHRIRPLTPPYTRHID